MSRSAILSVLGLCGAVALVACGDDGGATGAGGATSSSTTTATSSTTGPGAGGDSPAGTTTGTSGGGGGGAGGAAPAVPTAVAQIVGINNDLTGTATFTQTGAEVKLVLALEHCPPGEHASHLHANKDCGENGNAAGGHWSPNGEGLPSYTCSADGTGALTATRGTDVWTVGDGGPNDVTQFAFMVHANGEPDPGGRIGCGVIDVAQ